jgi:acetyltransferase
VPPLGEGTREGLDRLLPPLTWLGNPVDTGRPTPAFGQVLALVAADAAVDALAVYALEEGDAIDPGAALAAPGVAGALPIVFGTGGPRDVLDRRRRELADLGIPLYRTPEGVARAARALVEDARGRARAGAAAAPAVPLPPVGPPDGDEHAAKGVLAALGVAVPTGRACPDRAAAHAALDALGGPVVVKVLDPAIAHKGRVGGVRTGVADHDGLAAALDALDAVPGRTTAAYLVESEVGPGLELLVGGFRDPTFGPVVALGRGGAAAESLGPPALRLAPLSAADEADLVADLDPDLDPGPLVPVVAAVAALLLGDPGIGEIDVNPLRLTAEGPVALDVLVVRGQ